MYKGICNGPTRRYIDFKKKKFHLFCSFVSLSYTSVLKCKRLMYPLRRLKAHMKSCSVFTGNASKLKRRLHENYAMGRAGMRTLDQLNVMRQYLDMLLKLFPDSAVFAFTDGSSFPDDGLGGLGCI